mmetsp:Transcript_23530/g.45703  ORF Transcript_23530/g.45703 Transcript_23530/m.45703 type:complete len:265 (+) Transcript_23530:72-866(+)
MLVGHDGMGLYAHCKLIRTRAGPLRRRLKSVQLEKLGLTDLVGRGRKLLLLETHSNNCTRLDHSQLSAKGGDLLCQDRTPAPHSSKLLHRILHKLDETSSSHLVAEADEDTRAKSRSASQQQLVEVEQIASRASWMGVGGRVVHVSAPSLEDEGPPLQCTSKIFQRHLASNLPERNTSTAEAKAGGHHMRHVVAGTDLLTLCVVPNMLPRLQDDNGSRTEHLDVAQRRHDAQNGTMPRLIQHIRATVFVRILDVKWACRAEQPC